MLGRDMSKLLSHCEIQVTQLTERNVLLHAGGRGEYILTLTLTLQSMPGHQN